MNCASCKHWQAEKGRPYFTGREYEDMNPCGRVLHAKASPEEAAAIVLDASGYDATLYTRASFGCVLHEVIPDALGDV